MKVFKEEQKIKPLWIIVLFGIILIITLIPIVKNWSFISHQNIFVQLENFLGPLIIFLAYFLIQIINLKTKINEHGIYYLYFPFHWVYKTISWSEIESVSIRKYNAISEYGGWGFRFGFLTKKGMALTTCGSIGMQLKLKNGKKILIGTHKKDALKKVLETYQNKLI
jgi:hypothetical protein